MHSVDVSEQGQRIPRLASSGDSSNLQLSPEEGFLLSRIDGHTPWTLLRQIGGIAPEEVDRCIERWLSEGVIVVDADKSDSAGASVQVVEPKPEATPVDYASDLRIDSALDITPELQAQILEFEVSLDKSYFELLDVPRDADSKQIKRAYFSLSKVYHPDRYFRANLGDYSVRLERIFRKLVEAYELLSDPNTRSEIERTLGAMPEPESQPAPEQGAEAGDADAAPKWKLPPRKLTKRQTLERLRRHFRIPPEILAERKLKASHFFDAAMVAAKRKRWSEAAPSLRLAIAFDPWNDEYRASFSDILSHHYEQQAAKLLDPDDGAADPADKSEALRLLEEVLIHRPADPEVNHQAALLALDIHEFERATEYAEAACELSPESIEKRLTLARVLCADGLREKAKSVLTEAARLDPKNEEVHAEFEEAAAPAPFSKRRRHVMGRVIGIDLGTTNSCVAMIDQGKPTVIPNTGGYKTTPSMFAISPDGKRLVGHLSKRQAITNPENTLYAAKRLIGRRFDSPEVQKAMSLCPFTIVRGENDDARLEIAGKVFTCPEIMGVIVREMKRVAEEYLGEPVTQAVITVPAYFNDSQRQSTKDAGKIAGLEVLRIINEPTAAALAYGVGEEREEKIAVYDLGGGTFDISILELGSGVIEVLATAGDTFLGGEDFDRRLVAHVLKEFQEADGIDLSDDLMALQRLKDACEKAKCDLSSLNVTEINLPFIANDEGGARHLNMEVTRETLEGLVSDIVHKTMDAVQQCVTDAGLEPADIDQIVLVGGQTRMPLVQQCVTNFFKKPPHKGVNADEVVAMGAAIQADILASQDDSLLLLDVTPLSLGIGTFDGQFATLIPRNSTVPTRKSHTFTTTRDDQTAVKIRVLQGESTMSDENHLLGEFVLTEIPRAVAGEPEIEVSFEIDSDGIVNVYARDVATEREQSITVNAAGTLSEEEIAQIIKENEDYELPQ